jgi:tetratricopeptide (TPR) repeat protein
MRLIAFSLAAIALCLGGCQMAQVPNPNDPNQATPNKRVELIQLHLQEANAVVLAQVDQGQISHDQGQTLLAEDTAAYLAGINLSDIPARGYLTLGMAYLEARDRKRADYYLKQLKQIPADDCLQVAKAYLASGDPVTAKLYLARLNRVAPDENWRVAQVYMDLKEWKPAEDYLKRSLSYHLSDDRIVNDTLFYAFCQASLGDVDGAMATTRKAFSAPSEWKWPILYAVHFQIVPAALKVATPTQRIELGQLVEDAIDQHLHATGDGANPHFTGWFVGRKHLLTVSFEQAIEIYVAANRTDLVARVQRSEADWRAREPVEPKKLPTSPAVVPTRV